MCAIAWNPLRLIADLVHIFFIFFWLDHHVPFDQQTGKPRVRGVERFADDVCWQGSMTASTLSHTSPLPLPRLRLHVMQVATAMAT